MIKLDFFITLLEKFNILQEHVRKVEETKHFIEKVRMDLETGK